MQLWLSPMEGVSDYGFRKLCRADQSFTEMIRGDALARNNKATLDLIDLHEPAGIQLFVTKEIVLQRCLQIIKEKFPHTNRIDLNFGCPSPDVIKMGGGPAMLKRTTKLKALLTVLKKHSPVPCGIKIRLGLNLAEKQRKIYLPVIEIANSVQLDHVIVHAKVATDASTAPIDFHALQEILQIARIPIIGNGFVSDKNSAQKYLDVGCQGVMIARAAIVNPWIFEELRGKRVIKDYQKAWKEYKNSAEKYGTKEKFYRYHEKTFQLRSQGDVGYHAPSKILKWN